METEKKCCFTGYRPEKFPFKIDEDGISKVTFENLLFDAVADLVNCGVTEFFCGMAMGFDIVAAETVLDIGKIRKDLNVTLVAVIPFIKQSAAFSPSWKKRYDEVLKFADKKIIMSDKYFKGCYMKRNKYMVDNSDICLTYFDGKPGGTENTVNYAISKGRKVLNLAESTKGVDRL